MSMSRLIIDAANGAEYLAKARLETDGGRVLAQGSAVLASRQAFNLVRQGEYTFARVRPFPQDDSVQKEFGPHGLLFDAADPVANEPLLVHGGDFEQAGRPKAACGSIRIDARLLAAIVKHVQGMGVSSARARLVLDVRVGSKPSALKFWAQPRREEQVFIDDDYDIDFFDVLDWVREHERREDQERRDHERREQDRREDERHERERAEAVACERAQGRVSDDDRKPAEQECSTNPDAGPLFKVSAPPGVDSQGRVLEAGATLGQCLRPDEQEGRSGGSDTATRSSAGLTLAALAGAAAGESAAGDWAASGDAPSAATASIGVDMPMASPAPSDSAPESLVESATSY